MDSSRDWFMKSGLNHGDEIRLCTGGKTRSPRVATQEVVPDNTCGSRDHSRRRTATDPISVSPTVNYQVSLMGGCRVSLLSFNHPTMYSCESPSLSLSNKLVEITRGRRRRLEKRETWRKWHVRKKRFLRDKDSDPKPKDCRRRAGEKSVRSTSPAIGEIAVCYILTSLSEVPQIEQHLHSIHCHLYLRTETIMFAVNCKQVGCPITRTYARQGTRNWDGTEEMLSWDASRKVPGQLSCAEEQWTPSYRSYFFIYYIYIFFSPANLLFSMLSHRHIVKSDSHAREPWQNLAHKKDTTLRCLSPFLSTKNVRNNDTSSCFRTEYFISWYICNFPFFFFWCCILNILSLFGIIGGK